MLFRSVNVFVDDGQGFIDLGCDNYLEYDQDEDLILGYDGTWLCLDGHVAAFYMTEAGEDGTYGRIPARITREVDGETQELLMNIMVFIDGQGDAAVLGADPLYAGRPTPRPRAASPWSRATASSFCATITPTTAPLRAAMNWAMPLRWRMM